MTCGENTMKSRNIEGILNERQQFGENPIQEVRTRLLPAKHSFRNYFGDIIQPENPMFLRALIDSASYCADFYATRDAQWRLIQDDVTKIELANPLEASRYYDTFGKTEDSKRAKTIFLQDYENTFFKRLEKRIEEDGFKEGDIREGEAEEIEPFRIDFGSLEKSRIISEGINKSDWKNYRDCALDITNAYVSLGQRADASRAVLRYNHLCNGSAYKEAFMGYRWTGGSFGGGGPERKIFDKALYVVDPKEFKIDGTERDFQGNLPETLNIGKKAIIPQYEN